MGCALRPGPECCVDGLGGEVRDAGGTSHLAAEAFGGIIRVPAWDGEAACQVGDDQGAGGRNARDGFLDEASSDLVADLTGGLERAVEFGRDFFQQTCFEHGGPPWCRGYLTTNRIGT